MTPEIYDKAKLEAKHLTDLADDNKVFISVFFFYLNAKFSVFLLESGFKISKLCTHQFVIFFSSSGW